MKQFKVVILEIDGDHRHVVRLPFVPFVGLRLLIPWLDDFKPITQVYWTGKQFEVFID